MAAATDKVDTESKPAATAEADPADAPQQNEFFSRICKGDVTGVKALLSTKEATVEDMDEHGMTPLEHAAYRGNKEMCQLLIDMGAGVNEGGRSNAYTALHYAALSGKQDVCLLLLEKGAKAYKVNSVGRTAAQMGAFVGNHNCVSTINTFIPREDVEYFTVPHGINDKPKLSSALIAPVHSLAMQVNFHPVKIACLARKSEVLMGNLTEISQVLSLMSTREMKKGAETNEITAFKLHLLSHVLGRFQLPPPAPRSGEGDSPADATPKGTPELIEGFIKRMLRCREPGGIPYDLDVVLREGVRSFPFVETTIMQQLVTTLTHTKLCEEPGAWGIICSMVNGQKGFRDNDPCTTCAEEKGAKKCARCHYDSYCNKECQQLHWFVHKKYCKEKEVEYQLAKAKLVEEEAAKPNEDKDKEGQEGTATVSEDANAKGAESSTNTTDSAPSEPQGPQPVSA